MRLQLPRLTPERYRQVTLAATILLGIIIVTGGVVRLTDSGLGCPDWPTCHTLRRHGAYDGHALVEFVNRVFTGLVMLAVIACVLASRRLTPRRRDLEVLSWSLVAGVLGQAVLGGLVVLFDLRSPLVMAHFLLSIVILSAAIVLHWRARQPDGPERSRVSVDARIAGRVLLVVGAAVLVAGTFVTATGPHLGDPKAEPLGFDPPQVARVHGSLAIALLVMIAVSFWLLRRSHASRDVQVRLLVLLAVVLVQGAIGYVQYFNNVPAVLVGFHIAGAAAMWSAALWYYLGLSTRAVDTSAPGAARTAALASS